MLLLVYFWFKYRRSCISTWAFFLSFVQSFIDFPGQDLPKVYWSQAQLNMIENASFPAGISSRRLSSWSLQWAKNMICPFYFCCFHLFKFLQCLLQWPVEIQWVLLCGNASSRIKHKMLYWDGDESGQVGEAKVTYMLQHLQKLVANKHFSLVSRLTNFCVDNCRMGSDWGPGLVEQLHSCFKSLKHILDGHWFQCSYQLCWVKTWLRAK